MCRYMRLDTAAALALNVEAAPGENEAYSLVGVLNHCRTPQGQRLLKQWIKQPLIDLRHIGKGEGGREREGGRKGGREEGREGGEGQERGEDWRCKMRKENETKKERGGRLTAAHVVRGECTMR